MAYETREGTGSLFKNERQREGQSDADYNGSIKVDGVEYWLNAWIKNKPSDPNYNIEKSTWMSLSVKPKNAQQRVVSEVQKAFPGAEEVGGGLEPDSEIPFGPETR